MISHKALSHLSKRSQRAGGLSALLKDIKSLNGPDTCETVILKLATSTLWRARWFWLGWAETVWAKWLARIRGRGRGGVGATKLSFGVTQHPKQASGVISHSSRAERHRIFVKMENRNTDKVMEANKADGPFLALCFSAAQPFHDLFFLLL